jgi:cell division protein FtsW
MNAAAFRPRDPSAAPGVGRGSRAAGRGGLVPAASPQAVRRRAAVALAPARGVDSLLLLVVTGLAALGVLMVYSSSAIRAFLQRDDPFAVVGPQIAWAALGLVVMMATMRLDYRRLRPLAVPAYLAALLLLTLVFVPGLQVVVGGSARWLRLGPLPAVHPAEFAKLGLILVLARWLGDDPTRAGALRRGFLPFLAITLPVLLLVWREPDLGTTAVLALTAVTTFFVAGGSLFHLGLLAAAGAMALVTVGLRGYQLERIRAWLDPWAYADSAGFHTIQGLLALGLGGLVGAGLGESRMAGGLFLPNASNDFIFAVIGEEFGFLGGALVIVLFAVLVVAGLRIALAAPDRFGALLATGITAWLGIQAFVNIGVVVALLPVTGITLPFISAGGSSLVISFAAVGILLSISRAAANGGAWQDAHGDRGRGDRRTHLPGPRRRPLVAGGR